MKSLKTLLTLSLPAVALALPGPAEPSQTGRAGQEGPAPQRDAGGQTGSQGDGEEETGEVGRHARPAQGTRLDIFGRRTSSRQYSAADRLIGGWQLTDLVLAGSKRAGRIAQGAMVVTEGFMSLEVHAMWPVAEAPLDGETPEADIHLSFTAEYALGTSGQLVTATIIGSYIDDQTGLVQWERPGYLREYRVTLQANQLELSWGTEGEGTNRMVFRPRRPARPLTRDIFGAARSREKIGSRRDLFGRRSQPGSGERDVFGREKPAGEEEAGSPPPAADGREDGDR